MQGLGYKLSIIIRPVPPRPVEKSGTSYQKEDVRKTSYEGNRNQSE